jgi:TPR repeat protein
MNNLGLSFQLGFNGKVDLPNAHHWYLKAANAGSVLGMFNLGVSLEKGFNGKIDLPSAHQWFLKASQLKHRGATTMVIRNFIQGKGTPPDPKLAFFWAQQGAANRFSGPMFILAGFYRDGVGIEKDPGNARHWFQQAAQCGNKEAIFNLIPYLIEGIGGPPDLVAAQAWEQELNAIQAQSSAPNEDQEARVIVGHPEQAINATLEQAENYLKYLRILQRFQGCLQPAEWRTAYQLIDTIQDLHLHNFDYCQEIMANKDARDLNLGQSQKNKKVYLHPELSDLDIEKRADFFYESLKRAFDWLEQEERDGLYIEFFKEAFHDGLCLEGRMDSLNSVITRIIHARTREKEKADPNQLLRSAHQEIDKAIGDLYQETMTRTELVESILKRLNGKQGSDGIMIHLARVEARLDEIPHLEFKPE